MVDVTNANLPNPYDVLPPDAYMQELMSSVSGGGLSISNPLPYAGGPAAETPHNLTTSRHDYSSVTLYWPKSPIAIAYNIYLNQNYSQPHASFHHSTKGPVTLGGFKPGTSRLMFEVTAVSGNGTETGRSESVIAWTKALPGKDQAITSMNMSAGAAETTYSADVLVPYAIQHIYIWAGDRNDSQCDPTLNPAWPIYYNSTNFICAHYMLEGTTVYNYSGTATVDPVTMQTSMPWAWTAVGAANITQNFIHWKWTLPLGYSNSNMYSHYVVQVQGYGPLQTALTPCPPPTIDRAYAYCYRE